MRGFINALRNGRLLPGVALLVSILFVTGQLFNCCRLNETFGAAVKRMVSVAFHHDKKATHPHDESGEETHHQCHGHSIVSSPGIGLNSKVQVEPGTCILGQKDECLSEQSFSGKPMLATDFDSPQGCFAFADIAVGSLVPKPFYFQQPRPQNKSSPPLFLTTLRILV